jgi:CBS domain-containing protein
MRNELIEALKAHFSAHILKHKMNVEVMLNNPTAIHEHSDIMDAMEKEIDLIAEYHDKLEMVEKYLKG